MTTYKIPLTEVGNNQPDVLSTVTHIEYNSTTSELSFVDISGEQVGDKLSYISDYE